VTNNTQLIDELSKRHQGHGYTQTIITNWIARNKQDEFTILKAPQKNRINIVQLMKLQKNWILEVFNPKINPLDE
jgi:hypothetical protein